MVSIATLSKIRPGDRIIFKAVTRSDYKKATRKVVGVSIENGWAEVAYHGWSNFIVHRKEILKVIKEKAWKRQERVESPPLSITIRGDTNSRGEPD